MSAAQPQMQPLRRGGMAGPLLLVAAGVIFLLHNLGLISWSLGDVLWRLWPVLLIAIGVDLLIGRRVGALLSALLIVGVVAVVVAGTFWYVGPRAGVGVGTDTTFSQPLANAERGQIELDIGVGVLNVGALEDSAELIAATFTLPENERVLREAIMRGDTAVVTLRSENRQWSGPLPRDADYRWAVNLAPGVPLDLGIKTGVGNAVIDLSQLAITNLRMETGVGSTTVTLPATGRFSAQINQGIGKIALIVPEGMALRLQGDTGIGSFDVPAGYRHSGNVYTSPGYDTATDRIDLKVSGGIGNVSVVGGQ